MARPCVARARLALMGKYVNFEDGKAERGRAEDLAGKDYQTRPGENQGKIGSA